VYNSFIQFDNAFRFLNSANLQHQSMAAKRIVDMVSFKELGNMITFYWDSCNITINEENEIIKNPDSKGFNRFFRSMENSELLSMINFLHIVRNPLAHFYRECLNEKEIETADKYCEQLMNITEQYTKYI
jgi:hypothetical protein